MALSKGDFIELEYTGSVRDGGAVFDTTNEELARSHHIHRAQGVYGPIIIVLGEGQVLPGLDKALIGKEAGRSYTFDFEAQDGFGKRRADLLQLVPTKRFHTQKIQPFPGLQVQIDGMHGVIRSTSGGRTIVDFNHPLSGKDIHYDVKVLSCVTDVQKKVTGLLRLQLSPTLSVRMEGKVAHVELPMAMPKELVEAFSAEVKRLIPELESLHFSQSEKKAATAKAPVPVSHAQAAASASTRMP